MDDIRISVKESLELEVYHFNKNITIIITIIEALELYYKVRNIKIREIIIPENINLSDSFLKILYLISKDKPETIISNLPECIKTNPPSENAFFELNICIPYRARTNNAFRKEQLVEFSQHMSDFLEKKEITYKLIILEQNNDLPFNRGLLLNVGFIETEKEVRSKVQYYCHHNTDLFPEDLTLDYSYTPQKEIRDLFGYHDGLGAICLVNRKDFSDINGFANNMDGWGNDDILLKRRANRANIKINRDQYNIGVREISHERDSSFNDINAKKINGNITGLDNISYIINKKHIGKVVLSELETIKDPSLVHYLINFEI
jgi:hypothetical protein